MADKGKQEVLGVRCTEKAPRAQTCGEGLCCGSCTSTLRINIPRSFRARTSSCRSCRLPVPASDICGVPGVAQGCRALHDGSSTTGAATMRQAKYRCFGVVMLVGLNLAKPEFAAR